WQEHNDEGRTLSPAELCAGCPELVEALQHRLEAVRSMECLLEGMATGPQSSATDPTAQGDAPYLENDASLTAFLGPPEADNELGRLGKYRILKVLGHGGMGVVFQAEDAKLKRPVAVKAMLPTLAVSSSAGKRFLREAQAMAAVKHDHVVT